MSNTHSRMPLKPYMEAVQAHCEALSREELIKTLMELAQEVPIRQRKEFLEKIRAFSSRVVVEEDEGDGDDEQEALLQRISLLKEEIDERIASIENGTYWDDSSGWDDGYDEDPDSVSEEQLEDLKTLFLEADGLFLDGRLETAMHVYHALFDILDSVDYLDSMISGESLDLRESKARHCRCVYELADSAERVELFLQCMGTDDRARFDQRFDPASGHLPTLRDIVEAAYDDMPDFETFLPAWEKRLASCHGARAALLRMEAVQHLEGIEGVARLAREWKSLQPVGYLFWIKALEEKRDWEGMRVACREALDTLSAGKLREQAAACLARSADELGDLGTVLQGKRERFLSAPEEASLVEYLEEAEKQKVRARELEVLITLREQIAGQKGKSHFDGLFLKILLMAGKIEEAFQKEKNVASLGWSHGNAGIVFGAVLSVLVENSPQMVVIKDLLQKYAGRSFFSHGDGDGGKMYAQIMKGLEGIVLTGEQKEKYAAWADKVSRSRAQDIVSGKHRSVYDRAAQVLGALAEFHVLSGQKEKAASLLHEFTRVKFPRHSAFRAEVRHVVGKSPLLRGLGVS